MLHNRFLRYAERHRTAKSINKNDSLIALDKSHLPDGRSLGQFGQYKRGYQDLIVEFVLYFPLSSRVVCYYT